MDDLISRQAAKKALEDRFMEMQKRHSMNKYETNFCLNTILELPSVKPQEKTVWIYTFEDGTVLKLLDVGLSVEEVWKLQELHGKCNAERERMNESDN